MRNSKGFTLIELLIVVAIIGIIAAIAIPSLLRSRMSANQAAAMGALKTINGAQTDYFNNHLPGKSYASTLSALASGTDAGGVAYIDAELSTGLKSGYEINMSPGGSLNSNYYAWSAEAHPLVYQRTGVISFYIDETGVILCNDNGGTAITSDTAAGVCAK